ncbi:MAG: 2-dehydropantoate 2-reductase [Elusimicrobia bacterium]|nr:2-dehydropantoate 2-reductase [Elusimicrobiota bacterium]
MKIAVLGTGVIGGILGACLIKKGHDVVLIDASRARLKQLKETGLRIKDPKNLIGGDFQVKTGALFDPSQEWDGSFPEALFVSVKACVLKDTLALAGKICGPETLAVSFQNGLDTEEIMARRLGRKNVFRAVINYAGKLLEDGAVEVGFFVKPNYVGILDEKSQANAQKLAAILTETGLDTQFSPEIIKHVWEKVILNSAMSPLSALTGLTMRDVMDLPHLYGVVEGITREGIGVAAANGIRFQENFFDQCMTYLNKGGRHKPSMLVDVEAGRKTEIEFLNGKICEYAETRGLGAPYNQTITALIKGLETKIANGPGAA